MALLARAYRLAASAHHSQHRATDGAPFLDHVVEVATLLNEAGLDEELVTAGLLHDAVESGTLTEEGLRAGDWRRCLVARAGRSLRTASIESFE